MSENPVIIRRLLVAAALPPVSRRGLEMLSVVSPSGAEAKRQLCRILPSSEATSILLTVLHGQDLTQLLPPSLPPGSLIPILSSLFSMLTFLLRPVGILCLSSQLLVKAQFGGDLSPRYVWEGRVEKFLFAPEVCLGPLKERPFDLPKLCAIWVTSLGFHAPPLSLQDNQVYLTIFHIKNHNVGLKVENSSFTLDGSSFLIIAGTIHYVQVPRKYWRDRLLKLKACGFNTLTTWVLAPK